MSLLDELRKNRDEAKKAAAEAEAAENDRIVSANNFDKNVSDFVETYRKWAKDNKSDKFKDASDDEIKDRIINLVRESGVSDGRVEDGKFDSKDYYDYGNEFIEGIGGRRKTFDKAFDRAESAKQLYDKMSDDDKSALAEVIKYEKNLKAMKDSSNPNRPQSQYTGIDQDKLAKGVALRKLLEKAGSAYSRKKDTDDFMDIFENYESYRSKNSDGKKDATGKKEGADKKETSNEDVVEFMLTRGNDPNYRGFGQKLVDLGLATDNGLWGENGDVAYYTKQLNDQGIYGNLPIGKTIRLTRRK